MPEEPRSRRALYDHVDEEPVHTTSPALPQPDTDVHKQKRQSETPSTHVAGTVLPYLVALLVSSIGTAVGGMLWVGNDLAIVICALIGAAIVMLSYLLPNGPLRRLSAYRWPMIATVATALVVPAAVVLWGVATLIDGSSLMDVAILLMDVAILVMVVAVLLMGVAFLIDGSSLMGVALLLLGVAFLLAGVAFLFDGPPLMGVAFLLMGDTFLLWGVTALIDGSWLKSVAFLLLGVTALLGGLAFLIDGSSLVGVAVLLIGVATLLGGVAILFRGYKATCNK